MNEIIGRFSLNAIKFNGQVLGCMICVWIAVLVCAIGSLNKQAYTPARRRFWLAFMILVPGVGVLCYLPSCIHADSHPELFFWRRSK